MTTTKAPQGDLALLDHPVARELLNSAIPARLGYVAPDGTPRVIPIWFTWTGSKFVFGAAGTSPIPENQGGRIDHKEQQLAVFYVVGLVAAIVLVGARFGPGGGRGGRAAAALCMRQDAPAARDASGAPWSSLAFQAKEPGYPKYPHV